MEMRVGQPGGSAGLRCWLPTVYLVTGRVERNLSGSSVDFLFDFRTTGVFVFNLTRNE